MVKQFQFNNLTYPSKYRPIKNIKFTKDITMSSFEVAVAYILQNEGGYTVDSGGPTNYGIVLPILIEAGLDVTHDGTIDIEDIRKLSVEQAKDVYKQIWWDKYEYMKIGTQMIANKIFDVAVNFGPTQGHIIAQRACRAVGLLLKEDGVLGPKTLAALNTVNGYGLLCAMRSESAGVYRLIVRKHPEYSQYLKGWLNRAYL